MPLGYLSSCYLTVKQLLSVCFADVKSKYSLPVKSLILQISCDLIKYYAKVIVVLSELYLIISWKPYKAIITV